MSVMRRFELRGGSHDGERHRPSPPPPETLFAITTTDGERFARTGEESEDADGVRWALFSFDRDGGATERARRRFGRS